MSKKYPEIDDIWEFAGELQHIKEIKDKYVYYIVEEDGYPVSTIETYWDPISDFIDKSTYVGKSKCTINELFRVEN